MWSEVRLLVAAVALFLGGVPPALFIGMNVPAMYPIVLLVLKLCWLVSGVAAVYLLYRWLAGDRMLFGRKNDAMDTGAFLVMTVSGINLGLVGLIGQNIGMTISSNYIVFIIAAAVYLVSAVYLFKRWSAHGQKVF